MLSDTTIHPGYHAGYVVVDSPQIRKGRLGMEDVPCHVVDSELDLMNWMIDTVKLWDPDVLAGWELHNSSWGYLASRSQEAFGAYARPMAVDSRCRSDGAIVASRLRSFSTKEGFLLCYALLNI